jgi:hypothetical protein
MSFVLSITFYNNNNNHHHHHHHHHHHQEYNVILSFRIPLGILIVKGVTTLDSKRGSGPPKPRCEVSCQWLHGTGVVIAVLLTIPLGHQAAPRHIYAFHPHGDLWVVPFVPQFSWNNNGTRE